MKKLLDKPDDAVRDSLEGLAAAHDELLTVRYEPNMVLRADAPLAGKVSLVSGGGSGHEPMHAGFVGKGMLDAACPGQVFTSPTPDQILAAVRAVDGGAGTLLVVKNYTGDVMNFEMAAEMASESGISTETVLVDDDVAVRDSLYTAGRRGVGATVLVEKCAGAAAEQGRPLEDVAAVARRVVDNSGSMGLALTSCTPPSVGRPLFELGDGEIELGVGIHGEPGRERRPLAPAAELAELLARPILDDLGLGGGDRVLAFVSSLGGTPLMELYVFYRDLVRVLGATGVTVERRLVGSYMTSLEMAGCSVTLLRLDDELTALWDEPVRTAALCWDDRDG
ncbi:MAG: dihydroxyacetone kinase subunit DhaK [Actinomycetota bacterium]|nr:dihydroxyacetone kinase subunit DhaK [Actinomycetota bacterium]